MDSASIIGWGVMLAIAGIGGFLYTAPKMDMVRSGAGVFVALISQDAARQMQMIQFGYYASIAACFAALVMIVIGISGRSSEQSK